MKKPKYMERVQFWDDERNIDNGIIVTLHYGWSFYGDQHAGVMGFDTVREAKAAVKGAEPCGCKECEANK